MQTAHPTGKSSSLPAQSPANTRPTRAQRWERSTNEYGNDEERVGRDPSRETSSKYYPEPQHLAPFSCSALGVQARGTVPALDVLDQSQLEPLARMGCRIGVLQLEGGHRAALPPSIPPFLG